MQIKKVNEYDIKPVKIDMVPAENIAGDNRFHWGLLYTAAFYISRKAGGKTNLLYNELKHSINKKTNLIFIVPTFKLDAVWQEIEKMMIKRGINYIVYDDIIDGKVNVIDQIIETLQNDNNEEESEEEAPPIKRYCNGRLLNEPEKPKKKHEYKPTYAAPEHWIVIDDCSHNSRSHSIDRLLKIHRHLKARVTILSQASKDITPSSFKQLNRVILFKGLLNDIECLERIYDHLNLTCSFDEFYEMYKQAIKFKPYSFFFIDVRKNEYYINYTHKFLIEDDNI